MKKLVAALLLSMVCIGASANNIKLYIGSIETVTKDFKSAFYIQLILCNNTTDTVYLPENQLIRIQPALTNDISIITEGSQYITLANVPDMADDLSKLDPKLLSPGKYSSPPVNELDKQRKDANALLPQQYIEGLNCFIFAPGKCLTINSLMMTFPPEILKLHNVNKLQKEQMEANLVLPVEYYSQRNKNGKSIILISRSSDELKTSILNAIVE